MRLDQELFEDIRTNYKDNVENFKRQNSGLVVENVRELREDDICKFISQLLRLDDDNILVDRQFIDRHFVNFSICPVVEESAKGYAVKVTIVPDIVCEEKR